MDKIQGGIYESDSLQKDTARRAVSEIARKLQDFVSTSNKSSSCVAGNRNTSYVLYVQLTVESRIDRAENAQGLGCCMCILVSTSQGYGSRDVPDPSMLMTSPS